VNTPDSSPETLSVEATIPTEGETTAPGLPPDPDPSMQEYYQLQRDLFKVTLLMAAVIFGSVWIFYSLNIALNYLIGACTGVVYLRMLARNVEQLGRGKDRLGNTRLVLLVGLILIASRWDQLQILPIFLGFLTYKAALIFYMLRTAILPNSG
jgi:ATP synthase protein I